MLICTKCNEVICSEGDSYTSLRIGITRTVLVGINVKYIIDN